MKRMILVLTVIMVLVSMTTAMAKNIRYGRDRHVPDYGPGETYNDNYLTIRLGAFMPDDDAYYLDNGFAIGGAIGHNFNRNFALEVGLDYTVTDFDDEYGYYNYMTDDYEDAYVTTLGVPVTAKFLVPLSNTVDLFAGAGFGVYFTDIEMKDDYYDNGDSDTRFGFHALMGADFKMSPNAAVSMELKYTELDRDSDDGYDDFTFGGTTASVGMKFRF